MKHKIIQYIALVILSGLVLPLVVGADSNDILSLKNQYIKVFINNSSEETGRFAVDTTGGDPAQADDDNKPLIYGHPKPWTSYTTLQIDGANYVFGKGTHKRAGAGLPGGEIVQPPQLIDNQIVMKCRYGAVEVEQLLDITRSPSTGALDTARIRYLIRNTGTTPVEIGLRALLDTMVSDNDGAPFRIGDQAVTTDQSYNSNEYPDFWQAFDSLTKPAVIAQGTLRGGDVTPPGRIIFTNWGKAADHPWDIPIQPGVDFTRLGEDELDSAVAMYWNPRTLGAGAQFNITIYYGLGGITFAPGKTYLGITAPSQVQYSVDNPHSYTIMLYLEHHGEAKAENVKIDLNLPDGLECMSGETSLILPELMPGVTRQFIWKIKPNGDYQGDTHFQISVSGEHLESNLVTRDIRIIGPPHLIATVSPSILKIVNHTWEPYPAPVTVTLKNIGDSPAIDVKATFSGGDGIVLAPGECAEKYLLNLDNTGETDVTWQVIPLRNAKSGHFKVLITGAGIKPLTVSGQLDIPILVSKFNFEGPSGPLVPGEVLNLSLYGYNLQNVKKFSMDIKFDPHQLRLIYVSRGTFLVENGKLAEWKSGDIDNQDGLVRSISGIRSQSFSGNETTLMRLNFIVTGTGTGQITLENLKILNSKGSEGIGGFIPFQYQVEEGEK